MNTDRFLAFTAIVMSLCTLIVFTYQTSLIRKQQYASAYPHLLLYNIQTGTTDYKYVLQNNGVGPALIKSINIHSPNGEIFNDFNPYVQSMFKPSDSMSYNYSNLSKGFLIPANEEFQLIGVGENLKSEKIESLYEALNHPDLKVEIEYESIFGERWLVTDKSASPKKITD